MLELLARLLTVHRASDHMIAGDLAVEHGGLDQALRMFMEIFAAEPNRIELTRRLLKPGIILDTAEGRELVRKIVAAAP